MCLCVQMCVCHPKKHDSSSFPHLTVTCFRVLYSVYFHLYNVFCLFSVLPTYQFRLSATLVAHCSFPQLANRRRCVSSSFFASTSFYFTWDGEGRDFLTMWGGVWGREKFDLTGKIYIRKVVTWNLEEKVNWSRSTKMAGDGSEEDEVEETSHTS